MRADLDAARAEVERRRVDLTFTRMLSPVGGRIDRLYLNAGNWVTCGESVLTTIVGEDPMYVYFDIPEATALRILPQLHVDKTELVIRLADGRDYQHKAVINFVNNQVDMGKLWIRAQVPNPKLPAGHRLLSAGMHVRARVPVGDEHPALLVKDPRQPADGRADAPQGGDFLYVAEDQNRWSAAR